MSDHTAADIEAMLDSVAERQIRCPLCLLSNERQDIDGHETEISYVSCDWRSQPAAFDLMGQVILGDTDSDYCDPPQEIIGTIPSLLCCNNAKGHADGKAHWWIAPPETKVDYRQTVYRDLLGAADVALAIRFTENDVLPPSP